MKEKNLLFSKIGSGLANGCKLFCGRFVLSVVLLLSVVTVFTSCLSDDENENGVSSNDMAIMSFSLGTLNRYLHTTTASGSDSVYKKTLVGSQYGFNIDQEKLLIYNTDSLPYGTDVKHVICNIASKGSILIKSMTSDSLKTYSNTDSIDFSQPRMIRVYALDGSGYCTYTVKVNVHQQDGDKFNWSSVGTDSKLASLDGMKAISYKGYVYVAGNSGAQTKLYYSPISDGKTWTEYATTFPQDAYKNLICHQGRIFLRAETGDTYVIETEADGSPSATVKTGTDDIKALVGSDGKYLYALNNSGELVRSDTEDGYNCSWTVETLDSDAALLPSQDFSYTLAALRTNADAARLIVVGNRSEAGYPSDANAQIWGKIVEEGSSNSWMYYDGTAKPLPRLSGLTTFVYGDAIVALGGKGIGACTVTPLYMFYASYDGGISWSGDSRIPIPSGLTGKDIPFALTVDQDNFIWMICGDDGKIWRGRLNKLGWEIKE